MYKTIYDFAAEMVQEVIKARGEAIDGQKELIEAYLSDEAVTELYNKIFRVLCDSMNKFGY
jgi:myosin heavy subunit